MTMREFLAQNGSAHSDAWPIAGDDDADAPHDAFSVSGAVFIESIEPERTSSLRGRTSRDEHAAIEDVACSNESVVSQSVGAPDSDCASEIPDAPQPVEVQEDGEPSVRGRLRDSPRDSSDMLFASTPRHHLVGRSTDPMRIGEESQDATIASSKQAQLWSTGGVLKVKELLSPLPQRQVQAVLNLDGDVIPEWTYLFHREWVETLVCCSTWLFPSGAPSRMMEQLSIDILRKLNDSKHASNSRLEHIAVYRSSIVVTMGVELYMSSWGPMELLVTLVTNESPICVNACHMTQSTAQRLIVCAKGFVADSRELFGWDVYDNVLGSVRAFLARTPEVECPIERFVCPECLQTMHPKKAAVLECEIDTPESMSFVWCTHGHRVNAGLVRGEAHKHVEASSRHSASLLRREDFDAKLLRSVVTVTVSHAENLLECGSGFIADRARGLVVSASHMVELTRHSSKTHISIGVPMDGDGIEVWYAAEIAAIVESVGACVLRITGRVAASSSSNIPFLSDLPELPLACNSFMGENVRLIGYSQGGTRIFQPGSFMDCQPDVLRGYVCKYLSLQMANGSTRQETVVDGCGRVIPGHSGGPCLNASGEVVGMLSRSDDFDRGRWYLVPFSHLSALLHIARAESRTTESECRPARAMSSHSGQSFSPVGEFEYSWPRRTAHVPTLRVSPPSLRHTFLHGCSVDRERTTMREFSALDRPPPSQGDWSSAGIHWMNLIHSSLQQRHVSVVANLKSDVSPVWNYQFSARDGMVYAERVALCSTWLFPNGAPRNLMERLSLAIVSKLGALSNARTYQLEQVAWYGSSLVVVEKLFLPQVPPDNQWVSVELLVTLVNNASDLVVDNCDMSDARAQKLIACAKGFVGSKGELTRRGGYQSVVLKTVRALISKEATRFPEGVCPERFVCPDCLQESNPKNASSWDGQSIRSASAAFFWCKHGHRIATKLICGEVNELAARSTRSALLLRQRCIAKWRSSVVIVAVCDATGPLDVGCGFIADGKRGLILTAAHTVKLVAQVASGIEIRIGMWRECDDKVDFRFVAEVSVWGSAKVVDACVLRISRVRRMKICRGAKHYVSQRVSQLDLPALDFASEYFRLQNVLLIGCNQGLEGVTPSRQFLDCQYDVLPGSVSKPSKIPISEGTLEELVVLGSSVIEGHSGAPCLNEIGEVLGILSRKDNFDAGRWFLVPFSNLRPLLQEARELCQPENGVVPNLQTARELAVRDELHGECRPTKEEVVTENLRGQGRGRGMTFPRWNWLRCFCVVPCCFRRACAVGTSERNPASKD
jgi:S1-C subfamily serine protease